MKGFRSDYTSYKTHLDENKKVVLTERQKQAEHISNDIDRRKIQINQMEKGVEKMEKESIDCVKLAEEKRI